MAEDFETFADYFLSIYQSAVSEVAKRLDEASGTGSRGRLAGQRGLQRSAAAVLPSVAAEIARREYARQRGLPLPEASDRLDDRALTAGETARVCADLAFRYLKAKVSGDVQAIAAIEGEFRASVCDPAWATTIEEYVQYFGPSGSRREVPYIRASSIGDHTIQIPAGARIAMVGDWGTGAEPAVQVLKQIRDMSPDVFIHLGDIYYSGTPRECELGFTALINSVLRTDGRTVPAFTLAGNHDMYCGGVGYYGLLRSLNPEPLKQPASFFCLRSSDEKWQLLALDTGLHDYSPFSVEDTATYVESHEIEWHCARIREFAGRTILLSHHQLFSAFSPIGKPDSTGLRSPTNPYLVEALNKLKGNGYIAGWFWGHEHALTIYQPFAGLERGRCIGHGAVPVSAQDDIYRPVPNLAGVPDIVPNTKLRRQGAVYAHGHAMITLGENTAEARYYQDLAGRPNLVHSEVLT
jgi:Calcineurin-like phosphoesterase